MRQEWVGKYCGMKNRFHERKVNSMNKEKEKIKVYVCKSLNGARKLFDLFKSMNLDYIDKKSEKQFFHLYECGKDDIGFTIRFNTWQGGEKESNSLFDVIETIIFE